MNTHTVTAAGGSIRRGSDKSYWDGEESVCHYTPQPYYSGGVPGFAYGGIIASLIDCHGAATASAAKLREEGYALGEKPLPRFVAASIKVDCLEPTPLASALGAEGKGRGDKGPQGDRERDVVRGRSTLRERRGNIYPAPGSIRENRVHDPRRGSFPLKGERT